MSSSLGLSELCPLCTEPLDATERKISFCSCGFNICRFCWKKILESGDGRCPHCREFYDENKVTIKSQQHPSEELLDDASNKTKPRRRKSERKRGVKLTGQERKNLQDLRILQRNLVYAVGLSLDICVEKVLSQVDFFGQFGAIKKISVNRSSPYSTGQSRNGPTGAAYVTFKRNEDAAACVSAIDGAVWDGHYIRACFGTTKYCQAFLKGAQCNNPDCLYMHHLVNEGTFTKEEMNSGVVKGQPDLYGLINFDRSKGPVPGSLAKPPKGPGTGSRRDSMVQDRSKANQDQDWPQVSNKSRGSCELPRTEKPTFDLDNSEKTQLMSRKSGEPLWSFNSQKTQSGLNYSAASVPVPLQTSSKKSLTLSSPVKVKMVTNNRPAIASRTSTGTPVPLVSKLSAESALSLQSEDQTPSVDRYRHPHEGERLRETKSATQVVEDQVRDRESIQNMLRRRTSVPEHLVEESRSTLNSTNSTTRRGPPPGFEKIKTRHSENLELQQQEQKLQTRASYESTPIDAIKTLTQNMMEPTKSVDFGQGLINTGQQFVGNLQSPFVTNGAGNASSLLQQQQSPNLGFPLRGYNAGDMSSNSLLQSLISSSTGLGMFPSLHEANSQQLSTQGSVPLMQNRLSADAIDRDVLAIRGLSSQSGIQNPNSTSETLEDPAEAFRTMLHLQDSQQKLNFGQESTSNPLNDPAILAFKKSGDPDLVSGMGLQKNNNNNLSSINEQNPSISTNTLSPFDYPGLWGNDPSMPLTPFLMSEGTANVSVNPHGQWMESTTTGGTKMQDLNPSPHPPSQVLGNFHQNGLSNLQMMDSHDKNNSFLYSDQVSSSMHTTT